MPTAAATTSACGRDGWPSRWVACARTPARRFWGFIAFCGLLALSLTFTAAAHLTWRDLLAMGSPFALIAGLVLITELRPVVTAGAYDPQGVTISTAFVFAILFTWGPWPALLVHGAGVLLGELAKRKPLWKIVFNTGQYMGCLAVAAAVAWLGGMHATPTGTGGTVTVHQLPVMALCWVVYFLLNLAMVATVTTLEDGTPWWDDFSDEIGYYAITTFAVLALSPVVAVVTEASWQLLPLLMLPLVLVYKTASISREKEHASWHDALTGLANRKRLLEQMTLAGEDVERTGSHVALCLLDLDRFKEINDTLGHHTGDRLLEIAAARLARAVRPEDTVARLGGDEFAVLLTDVRDASVAIEAAERIRAVLGEPFHLDGMTLQVEASIGVALHPEHADTVPRLLQLADVAMYQAKEDRTGVELYRPERDIHTPDRLGPARLGAPRTGARTSWRCTSSPRCRSPPARPVGRGGAGPLGPPGPRPAVPGRVPRPRRAVRHDAPAHPCRAGEVAGPGRGVVAVRHRAAGGRQRLGARPQRQRVRRCGGRPAAHPRPAGERAQAGDHRARADGRPGPDDPRAGRARPARRRPEPGRLRHRLLLAGAPQAAAGQRDQGRPLVRGPDDHGRRRREPSCGRSSTWPTPWGCGSSPRASRRWRPGGRCDALAATSLRATSSAVRCPAPRRPVGCTATCVAPRSPTPRRWPPRPAPQDGRAVRSRAARPPPGVTARMSETGSITRDEVAHLARLARLALDDDELDRFAGQLDVIVGGGRPRRRGRRPPTSRRPRTRCR